MKRRYFVLLLFVCTLSLPIIGVVPPSFGVANVYVYPSVVTAEPGDTFHVQVNIAAVVDLFAWEFELSWNASVLNVTGIAEGTFLKGIQQTDTMMVNKTFQDEVDNDSIAGMCTRLGYISGADGSGTLAIVTFVAEIKGETDLHLFETKLADSRPTPYPIEHTTTDGLFSNIAGFPIASFTALPPIANINDAIVFNASASYDPDGSIVAYFWDFGDGQNTSETVAYTSHAYNDGGIYYVTLKVTDNESWNGTLTKEVKIRFPHDVAVVSVAVSHENVTVGETVTITVVAMNDGAEPESFTVMAYYEDNATGPAQTVSNLASGLNRTLTFEWNTEGIEPDDYRTKAVADLAGDQDLLDNTKLGRTITVLEPFVLPLSLYAGIGAVVVIAIVIVVFFLRRRGAS